MIINQHLKDADPEIAALVRKEAERKELGLELIPSENCVSRAVLEVTGTILTDKYCEGYPGARYYGGCQFHDEIENIAIERAKKMFDAQFANVQPHSGSNVNLSVYLSLLKPGDTVMGPRLDHGGHLTHGSPVNFSGKLFNIVAYGVNPETELFEEEEILRVAREHNPKMIICGGSAYSRQWNWDVFRKAADEVGAKMMADVAHYAGLIVGGAYDNAINAAHIVTTTTHKTLRGPRGGLAVSNDAEIMKAYNKLVFPGTQGGPLMHQIAAKAVAFGEALKPEFKTYAQQVVKNARVLANTLTDCGFRIVSGGTDSHLMLVDARPLDVTGAECEEALGKVGITVNKNTIPNDPKPPKVTSGFRVGTPAITTRGFIEEDMKIVAECIERAIKFRDNDTELKKVRESIIAICKKRPLFPEDILHFPS
jgi:glycine hydroxymethyltransferase